MIYKELGKEVVVNLHYFFSKWVEADEEEKENLKKLAEKVNARHAGDYPMIDSYLAALVSSLISFFVDDGIEIPSDEEIREDIKELEEHYFELSK